MEFITVGHSVRIACETFGIESDSPVLLVAGSGEPAGFWPESFCRALAAKSHFVIRYSHRDTGRSEHFETKYPIDVLLEDMLGIMDHYDAKCVHIVGHTMGAFMSEIAMCRWPWRFVSVTAISAGPTPSTQLREKLGLGNASEATWRKILALRNTSDVEKSRTDLMEIFRFLNGSRRFDEAFANAYFEDLHSGDNRNFRTMEKHLYAHTTISETLPDELRKSHCPFLAIHGTEDPVIPVDNAKAFLRIVPLAKVHLLQGAGQMFFDPSLWNEILEVLGAYFKSCY